MARKKNLKIQSFVIKFVLIVILGGGAIYFSGNRLAQAFRSAEFFKVQSIVIDPSLQFINKDDLKDLFGKNIFSVDLNAVQGKLTRRYPQASHLKLVKRFPNKILIVAKKRLPFAQLNAKAKIVTLDEEGVILSVDDSKYDSLPDIIGMNTENLRVVAGLPLNAPSLRTALKLIKLFNEDTSLSQYAVEQVNLSNMSKVYFMLSDSLQIIIDQDNIAHNLKVLGVILSQKEIEIKQVKYIDLRFKEPIIGKK